MSRNTRMHFPQKNFIFKAQHLAIYLYIYIYTQKHLWLCLDKKKINRDQATSYRRSKLTVIICIVISVMFAICEVSKVQSMYNRGRSAVVWESKSNQYIVDIMISLSLSTSVIVTFHKWCCDLWEWTEGWGQNQDNAEVERWGQFTTQWLLHDGLNQNKQFNGGEWWFDTISRW